jgi:hypothetical protein
VAISTTTIEAHPALRWTTLKVWLHFEAMGGPRHSQGSKLILESTRRRGACDGGGPGGPLTTHGCRPPYWPAKSRNVGNRPAKVRECTVGNTAAVGSLRCTHRGLTRVHAQTSMANQMQILTPKPASHRTMLPVKTGPRRTRYPKAYVMTGTASKTMIAHLS